MPLCLWDVSPKILPVVLDIQRPETVKAALNKVRKEGGGREGDEEGRVGRQ